MPLVYVTSLGAITLVSPEVGETGVSSTVCAQGNIVLAKLGAMYVEPILSTILVEFN